MNRTWKVGGAVALLVAGSIGVAVAGTAPAARKARAIGQSGSLRLRAGVDVSQGAAKRSENWAAVYRKAVPSVVVISTPDGYGTGFLVQSATPGLVITNHHVVKDGARRNLRVEVKVQSPEPQPDGTLMPAEVHAARVLRWDAERDLAVLQLDQPPAGVAGLPLAEGLPAPGEEVLSIGNGSAGILWALKPGNVAAIGSKKQFALARMMCTDARAAESPACKELTSGSTRFVQTNCPISGGDSGGPLLNTAGQVVGVNDMVTTVSASDHHGSFHVSLDELKAFLAAPLPAEAPPFVVSPQEAWPADKGGELADVDYDGLADTLAAKDSSVIVFDLAQGTFTRARHPTPEEVAQKGTLDAQLAVVKSGGAVYVWYDTDGDGRFDEVIGAGEDDDAATIASVAPDGALTAAGRIDKRQMLTSTRFKVRALAERMERLLTAESRGFPDPLWSGGRQGQLVSLEGGSLVPAGGNRPPDALLTRGFGAVGVLLDPERKVLAGLAPEAASARLADRALAVPAAVVLPTSDSGLWVFTALDARGESGIALHAGSRARPLVTQAFRFDRLTQGQPLPGEQGRLALRPGVVGGRRAAALLAQGDLGVAADDGMGSFPSWVPADARVDSVDGSAGNTVVLSGEGFQAVVADLDGQGVPGAGKKTPAQLEQAIREGTFRARFVWIGLQGAGEWTYYDTNGDGKLDLVLYGVDPAEQGVVGGWRVDATGAHADPALAKGAFVRSSAFAARPALRAASRKLFGKVFNEAVLEP